MGRHGDRVSPLTQVGHAQVGHAQVGHTGAVELPPLGSMGSQPHAGHPNPEQQDTGRGASVALGSGKQWGFDPLERLEGGSPLLQC